MLDVREVPFVTVTNYATNYAGTDYRLRRGRPRWDIFHVAEECTFGATATP